jgi:hypothetical protein
MRTCAEEKTCLQDHCIFHSKRCAHISRGRGGVLKRYRSPFRCEENAGSKCPNVRLTTARADCRRCQPQHGPHLMHADPKPEARTYIHANPRRSQTASVSQQRLFLSNITAQPTNCISLESFTAHWYQPCPPRISYLRRDTAEYAVQGAAGWSVCRDALRQFVVRYGGRQTQPAVG